MKRAVETQSVITDKFDGRRLSHRAQTRVRGHWLRTGLAYALAGLVAILFLLPLFWMISSSLKPDYQVLEFPPRWLPDPIRWANYPEALTYVPFGRYGLNTLFIAMMVIVGHILSCTVVAYAFARLRAPGKNLLFLILLATMMLPEEKQQRIKLSSCYRHFL